MLLCLQNIFQYQFKYKYAIYMCVLWMLEKLCILFKLKAFENRHRKT